MQPLPLPKQGREAPNLRPRTVLPRPLPKRGLFAPLRAWARRFWYWLVDLESPLALRRSFSILRDISPTPVGSLLRLLWPFPWYLPTPTPETPRILLQHAEAIHEREVVTYARTLIPLFRKRDTPQRSFYRMYDNFVADHGILLGYETEYFFKHADPAWALHLLPDPRVGNGPDPERDAVMASFLEDVVASFNWRLELGMRRGAPSVTRTNPRIPEPFVPERCPSWVARVPPLPKRLVLKPYKDPAEEEEDMERDSVYLKRNIVGGTGYLNSV